jgi:hypothetical protein
LQTLEVDRISPVLLVAVLILDLRRPPIREAGTLYGQVAAKPTGYLGDVDEVPVSTTAGPLVGLFIPVLISIAVHKDVFGVVDDAAPRAIGNGMKEGWI